MAKKQKISALATAGGIGTVAKMLFSAPSGYTTPFDALKEGKYGVAVDNMVHNMKNMSNWAPAVIGIGGSMIASKTGANRYISALPFLKW